MGKTRVRLCLKDVYRYIAIKVSTPILGIDDWNATNNCISVKFERCRSYIKYTTVDEDCRRRAIKNINKRISEVH